MHPKKRPVDVSDWRAIASLGEQLVGAHSLRAQRDRIVSLTSKMVRGQVDVWLQEDAFRLPGNQEQRTFPRRPRSEAMLLVLSRRRTVTRRPSGSASRKALAAVPIMDHGLLMGILQITRPSGPAFSTPEVSLLESIAGVVAVGLYASLRVEVERFRIGELNLVRQVSAEISSVLHLDELSRRVCELIQRTFDYYYVAIFTLKPGEARLRFRSSARSGKQEARTSPLALEVDIGQGLIGAAAATGKVVSVPDVKRDTRYRFIEPLPATRSEVAIPLKLDSRVLGVLDVQSDRPEAFHPNDLLVLEALAGSVARAVESARLYSDLRRRADQLAFLAEVSRSVTSTLELAELMGEAARLIHERFGYQHVSLYSVHPNRRQIEFEAGGGTRSKELRGYRIHLDDEQGIIPWVAREGKTLLAPDVSKEPRYRQSPLPPKNTRSELAVPLVFGEQVLGVLDIQSEKRNAFTEDDRLMFEAVAGAIAAAIRNADLYRTEQWRRRVADSLREVAGLLSKHIGVDEALHALLTELERNLPVDVSVIWLIDERGPYVAAVHGARADAIEMARISMPETADVLDQLLHSGNAIIRQPSDPVWPSGKAAGFSKQYSSLAVPLRVGERTIGFMALAHKERGRYGHEARGIAETFANYAAVAIENSRLYDAAQEQAYASAALLQVAQAAASPATLDEVLAGVVRMLPILLGVSSAAVYSWDPGREAYTPRAEFGLPEPLKTRLWKPEVGPGEFAILEQARSRGETVLVEIGEDPADWLRSGATRSLTDIADAGERILIAAPILAKGEVLGVMVAAEGSTARRFRGRRLEIIHGITQQLAMAIQNDLLEGQTVLRERLETEIHLARQVQKTFIPAGLPEIAGWQLAARWETARQVGGDFYDVVELPNGRLGIFVADVADKGMPAALFMALTRTLFRAALSESDLPGVVLRRMNDLLTPDTGQGMFVTAVYAVLDTKSGQMVYANAGHNPPMWIRTNGSIEKLSRTTIALGILDGPAVGQKTVELAPGDSVLLYTDGLTEAFSPDGEIFGETRLLDLLEMGPPLTAASLIEGVYTALAEFAGGEGLSDDLTIVAVRRT